VAAANATDSQPHHRKHVISVAIRPDRPHIHLPSADQQNDWHARTSSRSQLPRKELRMFTAEQFRAKAAEYGELLKKTDVATEIREFQRSKGSFDLLAQNEDWLTANFDKTVHSQDELKYDFAEKHAGPKTLSGPPDSCRPKDSRRD
jgi:hypothetical protein